jgi:hypothetical protein
MIAQNAGQTILSEGIPTWHERFSAGQRSWYSIASSSDGTHLAAVDDLNGYIYTSANSGVSWTQQTGSGQHYWFSIASSSDGTHLAAVDQNNGHSSGRGGPEQRLHLYLRQFRCNLDHEQQQ